MNRLPTVSGDCGGNNAGAGGGSSSYWSNNRQGLVSVSNESNLREIHDSLVPYRTDVSGSAYSAKSMASAQTISSTGTFMEASSSNTNQYWASSQQLHQMLTPNGFSLSTGGLETTYNGAGISNSQFVKSADVQAAKFRPTGVHREEALFQIKQSLQPYSTAGPYSQDSARNMDTLSSESSSGTTGSMEIAMQNGSPLHESILLDQLVQMGFERESAWYALKLTQFRSLNLAVDVLLKLNMSHVFRDQEVQSSVSRKPSFDSGEAGGRSESPMQRIPTPQGRHYQSGPAVSARPSAVSTSGAVYSIPSANHRTPSPMSKAAGGASNYPAVGSTPQTTASSNPSTSSAVVNHMAYAGGAESTGYFTQSGPKRSHITVSLQSPSRNNARGGAAVGGAADSLLVRERVTPVILQADKKQVEKPVAQNAVSPTVIAVNNTNNLAALGNQTRFTTERQEGTPGRQQPTKVLSAHFDPQSLQTVRINVQPASDPGASGHYVMKYQLEANTTSGHVVSIQGRGECPTAIACSSPDAANVDVYTDPYAAIRQNQAIRSGPPLAAAKLSSQRILLSSPMDAGMHTSNETLPSHEKSAKPMPALDYAVAQLQIQQQQQLQNYLHHILVGGNGAESVPDDPVEQHQQLPYNQRLKLSTHPTGAFMHPQKGAGVPSQKDVGKPADPRQTPEAVPPSAPYVPLPSRLGYPKTVECFPAVKEESSLAFPSRGDRASPTSSVSTEESENSATAPPNNPGASNGEPMVRSESPLPESALQRYRRCKEQGQAAVGNSAGWCLKPCTPQAFKFFMEQHVENVIKQHHERQTRRSQLEKEMVKAKLTNQVQCQMRNLLNKKESNYLRLKRQKMNASMFEKLKAIGVGAFGEVALVRKKDTATLFAMKTLRKSDVIQKNQAAHVKAERDVLSEADNEWVVKLFYSFQDKEHLFFIMEYIPGGDMMALLIKKGIFEEDLARFYISELVCAIQSVHKLGFIHRDIKPDNILIDRDGHIKLTDFGLCTGLRWTHDWKYYAERPKVPGHTHQDSFDLLQLRDPDSNHKVLAYRQQKPRQKSHSLVGTPNYIAPEVLTRSGHTQLCDWWSVGVILYEMVVGHPPFLANTPEETQYKVVNWRKTLHIPGEASLSPVTTDLILRLCCGVEERLGREPNAADIMAHPFFEEINWPTLRNSPAPYKPEILHAMDTSNFDPVEPRPEHGASIAFGTEKMSKHDHAFYEFTFRRFFDSDGHGCPTLKSRPPSQHPPLDTVMEKSQFTDKISNSEERDEWTASSSGIPDSARGYSASPTRLNEGNILRISTDDDEQRAEGTYANFAMRSAEGTLGISGPGRPPVEDFFYDEDVDDETSDSAVYV